MSASGNSTKTAQLGLCWDISTQVLDRKDGSVSPTIQKWLVRGLAGIITTGLDHWLSDRLIEERPPKLRSIQEDVKEAAFHAAVSAGAIVIASVLVRRVLRS